MEEDGMMRVYLHAFLVIIGVANQSQSHHKELGIVEMLAQFQMSDI